MTELVNPVLLLQAPSWSRNRRYKTASCQKGLVFEREVQSWIKANLNRLQLYFANPWLRLGVKPTYTYLQPDGILIDLGNGLITVVEIKLRHTVLAWKQLRQKYLPVVKRLFKDRVFSYSVLEVVAHAQPLVAMPEKVSPVSCLSQLLPETYSLMIRSSK